MAPLFVKAKAPAKINPVLEVLGKRPDGYHELALIFQTIELHDVLTFERSKDELLLEIDSAPPGLSNGDSNLILQAAELFLKRYPQKKEGVLIHLTKNIPLAAGLGGGSSDAAATLKGLDNLFQTRSGLVELQRMAEALGSDVPFFLTGGTALGTGRGEKITPLPPAPDTHLVLVKPGKGLATPNVYGSGKAVFTSGEKARSFQKLLQEKKLPSLAGSLFNGLEPATFFLMPETQEIKKRLLEAGARGALVCGSGPTVFGITGSRAEAEKIAGGLQDGGRTVIVTRTVPAESK